MSDCDEESDDLNKKKSALLSLENFLLYYVAFNKMRTGMFNFQGSY